jgi:hypothetical protein
MAGPFPGMNPYLESDLWSDFHAQLAVMTKRQLLPLLSPRYYPFVEKYFLLDSEAIGSIDRVKADEYWAVRSPLLMEMRVPLRVPHPRIEIRDIEERQRVTVIEFRSPTNKQGDGRGPYSRIRTGFLDNGVNLVEIDLLHGGPRLPVKGPLPEGSYYVFVCRADQRPKTRVWPIALDEPLPTIPIPLRKKREEVQLDLQKVVQAIYDQAGYDSVINYQKPPKVSLDEKELAWVDGRLRAAGLRK